MKSRSRFFQNRIVRNVVTLISGTAVAQLILIAFQLVLRRLYSPEVYGTFEVYLSIVSILAILSTLRYELAIVLPKDDETADNLVMGGIGISFCINFLLLFIIIAFKKGLIGLIGFPEEYDFWLYFIPLSTFLLSIYQFITYWLIRHSSFKAVSINKIFRRIFEGITQSVLGVFKRSVGLFVGDIVGNTANILSGYYQARRGGFTFRTISMGNMRQALKKYISFPKYQAIPAILNTTSTFLPVFFINKFFSGSCVGYFGLSRQVLAVPIAFITASLSQVLIKELSDSIKKSQKISSTLLKTAFFLFCGILPFIIIIMLWGEELFAFFFSDTWIESGTYSAILVCAFAAQFVVSPLSIVFTVLEKLKVLAVWQICYFVSIAALFFCKNMVIYNFLTLYTIINVVAYGIYFFLILSVCRKHDRSLLKNEGI